MKFPIPRPKSLPGVFLWTIGLCASAGAVRVVWLVVDANIEKLVEAKKLDGVLASQWSVIMRFLAENAFLLSVATSFVVGGAVCMWAYIALSAFSTQRASEAPEPPRGISPPKPGAYTVKGVMLQPVPPPGEIYEGAHEQLFLFVVQHLLPTTDAAFALMRAIGKSSPAAPGIAAIINEGIERQIETSALYEYVHFLHQMRVHPPKYIEQEAMEKAVDGAARYYADFVAKIAKAAMELAPDFLTNEKTQGFWQTWHTADERMQAAYAPLQLNSRLKILFKPGRPNRWQKSSSIIYA